MYGHRVALGQAVHAGPDSGNDTGRFVSEREADLNDCGKRSGACRLIHELEIRPAQPCASDLYEHLADARLRNDHFTKLRRLAPLDKAIGFHGSRHVAEPTGLSATARRA